MSPAFSYTAIARDGSPRRGEIDAEDIKIAKTLLQAQGFSSVSISKPKGDGKLFGLDISGGGSKNVKPKDLAIMSRQMATMISAGLPVLRTLRILAQQTDNKKLSKVLEEVSVDVEGGIALSTSMAKHPEDIPPIMIGLVAAGEQGGFLDQALENVAATLERDTALKATIKSAMTYPVAVLALAVVAVIAMLIWVVPIFEKMFADLGG
ncbi:MAG: type II secretion system F family protein, partial [Actinomycetota bacterium]